MDSSTKHKTYIKPQPLADLLPGLTGILSKESVQVLASAKKTRKTMMMPRTADKNQSYKPRTMAEMSADIMALRGPSPKRYGQQAPMKSWNSSVKVDQKKISHTGGKNSNKHASVRKILNFQTKAKPQALFTSGPSVISATPKFLKPEVQAKKSTLKPLQGKDNVRISGIYAIPQTPLESTAKIHPISRLTANKENIPKITIGNRKSLAPSKILYNNLYNKYKPTVPDTPTSNSSSDASFLQKEKEINDSEIKYDVLENIAEISPPVSTPFKNYRSVHEYFMDDSNEIEKTEIQIDNTMMVFDKASMVTEDKKEESIIVSLCDLLNKATITNPEKPDANELTDLLQMEKQTIDSVKWIEGCIGILSKIKDSHEASLKNIQNLITKARRSEDQDRTLVMEEVELSVKTETATENEVTRNVSVIKYIRSPSYTIPRKNTCLRKKVLHKSMPNDLNIQNSENTIGTSNRAISMYLEMKEKMNFLNTPVGKIRPPNAPLDTPAVTSRNLQMQLDRLYNDS